MRRLLTLGLILPILGMLSCAAKPKPKVEPPQDPSEWILTPEALDSDTLCVPKDQFDEGLKHCRTVREVRDFLRSLKT